MVAAQRCHRLGAVHWKPGEQRRCLGRFAELEIRAPEERLDAARDALLRAAADLGLTQGERRSYLEMVLTGR